MLFTDSNGIEIQRASWGQTVNIWLKQDHLVGEEVNIEIWDKDYLSLNDRGGLINNKSYDGNSLSFSLNKAMEGKTGSDAKLYIKVVAPKLTLANDDNEYEGTTYLEVQHVREIYGAHIGSQDGKDRHYHVDYDKVSYFYAKSRGIKPDEQLNLTIYEKGKGILQAKNVHADKSGMIKIQLEWNLLNPKTAMRIVYAVVKDKDQNILYNGAKVATGPLEITKKSAILKLAEYKSAVMVGKGSGSSGGANGVCVCKEYDLIWGNKVSCEFRKKVPEISKRQNIDPNNFMAAMAHETGGTFDPTCGTFKKEKNENEEGYVGLLQIGKDAATDIGITRTALIKLTAEKQLDYMEDYLSLPMVKGKLNTLTDFYLAVLFPVDCGKGKDPDHIVFDNSLTITYKPNGKPIKNLNYWRNVGYAANKPFLKEGINEKGKTYIWEIAENIKIWYDKGEVHKSVSSCKYNNNEDKNSKWHEPVDNPISTLYMQSGGGGKLGEHWGLFGKTRNRSVHQGLDLFVEPGSNVYSCAKGEVYETKWHGGYGNTLTIKISDKEAFFNHRREYKLLFPDDGEIVQGEGFDKTKDIFLFYAHLRKVLVKKGDVVLSGDKVATSGVSGVDDGTSAPHLHFEIFTSLYAIGMGLQYRCNPGFYVHFKSPEEQTTNDKELQKKVANNGNIEEFNGKD